MFQETSPEILNEIITINTNDPVLGRLEINCSPERRRRRSSEESESIAELVLRRNNPDDSDDDDDSDGYSTPDEDEETVGVSSPPRLEANIPDRTRVLFTTPCGQTYWVDDGYWIYTNRNVELPIGYWCEEQQGIMFEVNIDESDDEYEDTPPSPAPPRYTETPSTSSEPDSSDEVEGETILIANSQ